MPMTEERLDELDIPLMVAQNTTQFDTAFCVSIEAKGVTSTGISAADRAATVLAAIDPKTRPARPGAARAHVSAARAERRRARARRADRGRRRPRADRRPLSRRRDLRNHERRRHDGARAGADEVREEAQAADDHDRRPDPVPDAHRGAGPPRRVGGAADRARRVPRHRLREPDRRRDARRAGQGRDRRRRGRHGPRALAVPDRRRVPLGALRLRPAARRRDGHDRATPAAACCST